MSVKTHTVIVKVVRSRGVAEGLCDTCNFSVTVPVKGDEKAAKTSAVSAAVFHEEHAR